MTAPQTQPDASEASTSNSEWIRPPHRPEHIHTLISGVDRYNPQNLEFLEEYLSQQLHESTYDCLANLAILKLYQFNPDSFNYAIVLNVLLKALTAAPMPDFQLALSLLGEMPSQSDVPSSTPSHQDPTTSIGQLTSLSALLTECKFPTFWSQLSTLQSDPNFSELQPMIQSYSGFEEDIRQVVQHAVTSTFRTISTSRLASYLNLKDDSDIFKSFVKESGWSLENCKVVKIPSTAANEIKATVIREDLQLDQLSRFVAQAQALKV